MGNEAVFIAPRTGRKVKSGAFEWSAPSNIALVKYWGKKGNQIPANPSLSFTLNHCKTVTNLNYHIKEEQGLSFEIRFEGKPKEEFRSKIQTFFERIEPYCSYIREYHFVIDTHNTFPHSSGIASSASGMAALAMNVMSLEKALYPDMTEEYLYQKASFLARLGSGSACRSIRGEVVVWGEDEAIEGSSDLYGVAFSEKTAEIFHDFQDVILLVDKGEKKVSSSVGHDLMWEHPYASQRSAQAHENIAKLSRILQQGDLEEFITLVEREALTLHGMMMTSMPYFILMKPNTLQIIERIWSFREDRKIPVCFTLDAGANVHLLFPKRYKEQVMPWIATELAQFCQNGHFIEDQMGSGVVQHI